MPQFKRVRLFMNTSMLTPENVIYDEVWAYKLVTDNGARKEKYRIRYQKTDAPTELTGITEEEAEIIGQMLEQYGPAISCTLDVWKPSGWVRCLDWMGDPALPMDIACMELNDQFKAFITGIPCPGIFSPWVPPTSPKPESKKKDVVPPKVNKPKTTSSDDEPDFTWI